MNQDEFDRLIKQIKDMEGDIFFGNFSTIPAPPPARMPSVPQWSTGGISPTDVDAKGQFPYQEPEQDEQGTYYGYKILRRHCRNPTCGDLVSPRYPAMWKNGSLEADREPSENSMHGIHFTKRPDHPELQNYVGRFNGSVYSYRWGSSDDLGESVLVKCALSGTVVETEQGFRAEYAQIVGVLIDGHWRSYQDYQERTRAHSRTISKDGWEAEEWKAGLVWGRDWTTYPNPDTSTGP